MKYVIKGRVISTNGKGKDTIILKSIIKEKYSMKTSYTKSKRRRLHIP